MADPISKKKLQSDDSVFFSNCGSQYKISGNTLDFRIPAINGGDKEWQITQQIFEEWFKKYIEKHELNPDLYDEMIKEDSILYENFKLEGNILDVGGQLGFIKKYIKKYENFVVIDPFISCLQYIDSAKELNKRFDFDDFNFISGFAEFLPFQDLSFDCVNMRSCVDHFSNAFLAFIEAYRVLKFNGKLIVGISIEKGTYKDTIKNGIKYILPKNLYNQLVDAHMWHPEYDSLIQLAHQTGFSFVGEVWQSKTICFFEFSKQDKLCFNNNICE